jgi:chaperone modulatory protein CbpM
MENLIAITDICTHHEVEYTFISSLNEAGLLEIQIIDETSYISGERLRELEKMIRMHHELEINIAGIEAITHLLQRVEQMQEELRVLRNRVIQHH